MLWKLLQGRAKWGGRKECAQPGRGKHGSFCARARKKQGVGLSAAKVQIFCMAHAEESNKQLMGVYSQASWQHWRLGLSGWGWEGSYRELATWGL